MRKNLRAENVLTRSLDIVEGAVEPGIAEYLKKEATKGTSHVKIKA
jgi:hypothetical protein